MSKIPETTSAARRLAVTRQDKIGANKVDVEEFDYATYARCSDNNMPIYTSFMPLTEEEQAQAEAALKINGASR